MPLRSARLEQLTRHHGEVLDDRPERERREEGETADDQNDADQKADESPPWVGKVPVDAGTIFLATSEPATAIIGMMMKYRPISMARPPVVLYQSVLPVMPAKAEPLFPVCEV